MPLHSLLVQYWFFFTLVLSWQTANPLVFRVLVGLLGPV